MNEIEKVCGTCRYWDPGEIGQAGTFNYKSKEPVCKQRFKKGKPVVFYERQPGCLLWKEADPWDLVLRKRAGWIDGDFD